MRLCDYPEPDMNPPDDDIAYICDRCGEPIRYGDEHYHFREWNDSRICEDCMRGAREYA